MASQYLDTRHGRIHYIDEGPRSPLASADRTLLFVHGTPTNSYEYRHLIASLSATHRCIAPDHLGFGQSERPAAFPYTPEAHADVLREFVDRLRLERLTLVVHDFGGPIGLPLALADASRVDRVILMNTWAWPLDDDEKMARGARFIAGRAGRWLYKYANASLRVIMPSAYGDRRKLTRAIHRRYLEIFRDRTARVLVLHALAKALLGSRAHYQWLLDRIGELRKRRVLIVWGMKDSAFQPYQLTRWRALLPDAEVVPIEGAGHWPHEEEPARVIDAIQRFLK
ncbi:MAG TPA: alpha/beta fold hydrolase [Vicinamibacterales bacterium]|nr:alpha/beta fold hydrolase [Vicinamibacterales bacterium]